MCLDGLEGVRIKCLDSYRYSSDNFGIPNAPIDNETGPVILVRQRRQLVAQNGHPVTATSVHHQDSAIARFTERLSH